MPELPEQQEQRQWLHLEAFIIKRDAQRLQWNILRNIFVYPRLSANVQKEKKHRDRLVQNYDPS